MVSKRVKKLNRKKRRARKHRTTRRTNECSYHLCNRKGTLYRCRYCGRIFCKEHIKAKPPGTPKLDTTTPEGMRKQEEWRSPNGHPCPDYLERYELEQRAEKAKYSQALARLIESKPLRRPYDGETIGGREPKRRKLSVSEKISNYWYWHKRKIVKAVILLAVLPAVAYLLYKSYVSGQIQSIFSQTYLWVADLLRNSNLTELVSFNPDYWGYYAVPVVLIGLFLLGRRFSFIEEHGNLILVLIIIFGISIAFLYPYFMDTKLMAELSYEQAKASFDRINEIRSNNGVSPLVWDDDLYRLAKYRAEDQYDRGYFSHDSPEGHDIRYYATIFGVQHMGISENIGKGHYNMEDVINGWEDSPGHFRNLLFGNKGAVAVYGDIYVYVSAIR